MKPAWLGVVLVRLRRILSVAVDLALLTLVSAGAVWLMKHKNWTPPVTFGAIYWGGLLLCLFLFRGTPGMYALDLRIHEVSTDGLFPLRCLLRVASSYALFMLAPGLVGSIALSPFSIDPPYSLVAGVFFGFLASSLVASFLLPRSVQDVLSGTTIGPRTQSRHGIQPPADTAPLRMWFGLGLVASACLTVVVTYLHGVLPFNFEGGYAAMRQVDSPFLQSQLGMANAPIVLRERPGSPFFRPAYAPGPSLAISASVNGSVLNDTGERRRVVNTILTSLSYLQWAGQVKEDVAEVTLITQWAYGYMFYSLSYSYVGTWQNTIYADGGITEAAMETLRQAERAGQDTSHLELPRLPFENVKPERHRNIWVGYAPSLTPEEPMVKMFEEKF